MDRWDLLDVMKNKRKFLTEKEIAQITKKTQPSINRMLRSLSKGHKIITSKRPKMIGNSSRLIKHYKYKK